MTALKIACNVGNSAIVTRLLQEDELDINYQVGDGVTAAHEASREGHPEIVRLLAETGKVDWNKKDMFGLTPLYDALFRGYNDIVDIIVQQSNIDYNVKTEDDEALAQVAVKFGGVKCVETLAAQERFDCWNVPDKEGVTPIMMALKEGKTEIVDIILSCPRVDLSCKDRDGWSLLFRAFQMNDLGE